MGVTHGQCLMSPDIMTISPLNKSYNMGLFELIITLYIGAMIYFANLADFHHTSPLVAETSYLIPSHYEIIVRRMLYGLITMVVLFSIYADRILLLDLSAEQFEELGINPSAVSLSSIIFITVLTFIVSSVSLSLILSPRLRQRIHILFGKHTRYNDDSQVQRVAMILVLCLVGYLFINFVIGGGLSGVAQSIQENGISISSLVFQAIMFIVIACLGVGLAIRRTLPQTLERLGLKRPTPQNVLTGIVVGIALIAVSLIMTLIWTKLVTPEQYAQQSAAAAEIDSQFNTVQAAFLLALTSAVSEEILFRGALQPVFGIPLTTIFFVLFHDQYTLTPAMLIILIVGSGLALLRRYQSTTSAIIAHFVYNFVPIALIILLPQAAQLLGLL
jgi:membrane protease YdiL (CAAX protease family)